MNSIFCPQENTEEALLLLLISESMVGKTTDVQMLRVFVCIPFSFLNENIFVMPCFLTCVSFSVRKTGSYFWNSSFCSSEAAGWALQMLWIGVFFPYRVTENSLLQIIDRWTQSQVFSHHLSVWTTVTPAGIIQTDSKYKLFLLKKPKSR